MKVGNLPVERSVGGGKGESYWANFLSAARNDLGLR